MESLDLTNKQSASRGRWLVHFLLIAGYIPVLLIGHSLHQRTGPELSQTAGGLLWVCAQGMLIFALVFGLACFASRATREDLLLGWRGNIMPILLGAGYSVALRIAAAILSIAVALVLILSNAVTLDSLKHYRPTPEAMVDVSAMRSDPVYFWLTLTVVSFIVAGLREELWRSAFLAGMRALWPQQFRSKVGQVLAVVICAGVFGIGHWVMGPMAVCFAGFIGIGLGLIMVFHGSIWPAVFAHGIFDATTMALLPWALSHTGRIVH